MKMMRKNQQLKRMLAAFAALLCLMPVVAQNRVKVVVDVTGKQAKITQTSTLYLGEVVLNGQQSFYYLFSTIKPTIAMVITLIMTYFGNYLGCSAYKLFWKNV